MQENPNAPAPVQFKALARRISGFLFSDYLTNSGVLTMRVAITGASSGIGKALALEYAADGADIVAFGRDVSRLRDVAENCNRFGVDVEICAVSLENKQAMSEALLRADNEGRLDVVIANAGFGGLEALAGTNGETEPTVEKLVNANFVGVLNTLRPIIPRMVARRAGNIGIISSLAGLRGMPDSPVYSATKAAARVYGEALRPLLAPYGVSVSVISPGYVDTPMSRTLPFAKPMILQPEKMARLIKTSIKSGTPHLVRPLPLAIIMRLFNLLPRRVADTLLIHLRQHTNEDG
ncbi:MAG: SDR family NAD(P)-dependent oxidoreductase [Alphaproteobacteria bacterium]|nr:SDR family NAD(P)-dependent oxidoreductase [Alphaproteobacteria bacterium]